MEARAAIVITGAPGSGKSATAEALSNRLTDAGVEHGAVELEQFGWGHPWLSFADCIAQLAAVLSAQRRFGRRLFLIVATVETDEQLEALASVIAADRLVVAALRADPHTVAERIRAREPASWAGREGLAERAALVADLIPRLRRVDVVLDTNVSSPLEIAIALEAEVEVRGLATTSISPR